MEDWVHQQRQYHAAYNLQNWPRKQSHHVHQPIRTFSLRLGVVAERPEFRQYLSQLHNNMGNQPNCSNKCDQLANEKTKKSPAYGHFQLLVNNHREYALVHKTIDKQTMSKRELEAELQRRKNMKSPHLISLCAFQISEELNYIDFKLQYEYISLTLWDKLKVWRQMDKRISENEISNIILGVEQALQELYHIGIGHRCINFETVLCFNSLYKLSDISMVTFLTGYDLALQGDQHQFLSNSLLEYLHYQGTQPQYEIEDDFFSLALLTLAIVLDCSPQDFYMKSEGRPTKINKYKLEEGLKAMSLSCSPWLVRKVKGYLHDGRKEQSSTAKESSSRKISSFAT